MGHLDDKPENPFLNYELFSSFIFIFIWLCQVLVVAHGIFIASRWDHSLWCSVQFSCSVMSNSLWPHEPQHTRPPCLSPTPGVYPNSCALSLWYLPTISSSVVPFSCLQFFPTSGNFQMSQLFTSGHQSIGAGASAASSVLPMNIQGWFPLGLTSLISLQSRGFSSVFCSSTIQKHQSSVLSLLYSPTLRSVHDYWKNHSFDYGHLFYRFSHRRQAVYCFCLLRFIKVCTVSMFVYR